MSSEQKNCVIVFDTVCCIKTAFAYTEAEVRLYLIWLFFIFDKLLQSAWNEKMCTFFVISFDFSVVLFLLWD